MRYLVEVQRVNIDATDVFNNSALVYAVEGAHLSTVEYLVQRGANLFATIFWFGNIVEISKSVIRWHEYSSPSQSIVKMLKAKLKSLTWYDEHCMQENARRYFKLIRPSSPD